MVKVKYFNYIFTKVTWSTKVLWLYLLNLSTRPFKVKPSSNQDCTLYSAVKYSAVQCSKVQYSTVKYSTVQCNRERLWTVIVIAPSPPLMSSCYNHVRLYILFIFLHDEIIAWNNHPCSFTFCHIYDLRSLNSVTWRGIINKLYKCYTSSSSLVLHSAQLVTIASYHTHVVGHSEPPFQNGGQHIMYTVHSAMYRQ